MTFTLTHQAPLFAPGSLGQVHASTLLCQPDGTAFAAWFAGTKEGHADVAIVGSHRVAGVWKPPARWAKINDLPHWNPVLFQPPREPLALCFKTGATCDAWTTHIQHATGPGPAWSAPRILVDGDREGRGPAKNKPITLSDGALLAPASREDGGLWRVFTDRSTTGGRTWTASPDVPMDRAVITGKGAIQPTLWESAPGLVHMLVRTSCGWICRCDSTDGSRTWSPLRPTSLPNNNSGIDLDRDAAGRLLLACNPVGGDWAARTPLTLLASGDNGATWERLVDLESEPGEYSYPAVIATPTGFAGTYTWKRETIVFWEGSLHA